MLDMIIIRLHYEGVSRIFLTLRYTKGICNMIDRFVSRSLFSLAAVCMATLCASVAHAGYFQIESIEYKGQISTSGGNFGPNGAPADWVQFRAPLQLTAYARCGYNVNGAFVSDTATSKGTVKYKVKWITNNPTTDPSPEYAYVLEEASAGGGPNGWTGSSTNFPNSSISVEASVDGGKDYRGPTGSGESRSKRIVKVKMGGVAAERTVS
ncbi:MAG: hypothetical protein H7Y38_00775, partial [Armatimonadetes bacterium]|nr:hypothetical protein [Armatimonadota bacterium]